MKQVIKLSTVYQQVISQINCDAQLNQDEIEHFISLLRFRKIKKNQFLMQRGEIAQFDTFVKSGCLKSSFIDEQGMEHIVQFAIEDEWISDYESLTNRTPARLEIMALEDSELLQLDHESLEHLFEIHPKFEHIFRKKNQRSFVNLYKCLISFMSSSAEERYIEFVRQHPKFVNRIPQYQIASYLGITPEYLSKIRRNLTVNGS